MLESVPWPNHLRRVVEYAGGHHERMDGKGYPKGLRGDQMSVQARIMAIADIFEALTASDRPYKKPMKLSQSLGIMKRMSEEGHIDPDLFEVFVSEKIYLDYGKEFLGEDQLDMA
jgi:HD-GYP domain-containing protein (c-di-GMP phosphodiesterase class II)